jgi:hypothetical protein
MNLAALRDGQERDRYLSILWKNVLQKVRPPRDSKPIFVFGKQRSGTSMLMYAFHRHPDVMVYDEHRNNEAFDDYRIRSFAVVNEIIRKSSFPAVCFKPICDSHLIAEFAAKVPGAHFIWLYRDFQDVANSSLRKFGHATRAIKLVCEGKPGGGWLQEGVTPAMQETLSSLYRKGLSDFDLCCLVWWVRNKAIVDSGLLKSPNLSVIKYETLVTKPLDVMPWLFDRLQLPFTPRVSKRMSARSIGRNPYPAVDPDVHRHCQAVLEELDDAFRRNYLATPVEAFSPGPVCPK